MNELLPALPDAEFQRVLCVAAHPDDIEYGGSAAVAAWTRRGVEVAYLLLTAGEAGMQRPPEETARVRRVEQERACEIVGVDNLTILNHPDGMLSDPLPLRRDIARVIRQFRPDAVLVGSWEFEAPWGINHADHRIAGYATVDAIRDADNTWIFPELATEENLPKWSTRWLLVNGHTQPTHGVDVTGEPLTRGIASLAAHEAYFADLPNHPPAAEFLDAMTAGGGQAMGVRNAVLFRAYDFWGGPPGPDAD